MALTPTLEGPGPRRGTAPDSADARTAPCPASPTRMVARADGAVNKVLQSPDFAGCVARLGHTPRPAEPGWFRGLLRGRIETLSAAAIPRRCPPSRTGR